ncbi:hypothetical protein QFC19_003899 [Naganishia cerealis]|uniref:Uncharacterized protein n=1 Tax=Naganishia cerealis TaxID=610337 RepID=A0ACC2VZY1_9TREE|nr:hypothetical protein QFC19_003899 [Naganishia cerealis]
MASDDEAKYREALAAYHSSLRENFLSFLWSRPAHESFSAERNGLAQHDDDSADNVFDLRPRRSDKRKGRVFSPMVDLASPEISENSRQPGPSGLDKDCQHITIGPMDATTVPTSPILEKSLNVINPLTGRRLGSNPRLPTPPGREQIRQQAIQEVRRHRRQPRESDSVIKPRTGWEEKEAPTPPMERSKPNGSNRQILQPFCAEPGNCLELSVFGGYTSSQRKFRSVPSCPSRSVENHRAKSLSSSAERGRIATEQLQRCTFSASSSSAVAVPELSRLRIKPLKELQQMSYYGTRRDQITPRYQVSTKCAHEETESESESEPSSTSGRSSQSSLAVTSPVARHGSSDSTVITGGASFEGPTIVGPRHVDDALYPPLSATHPLAKHRLPIDRTNSTTTTLTDLTPRTEGSEASFAALAPSPVFATEMPLDPTSPRDRPSGVESAETTSDSREHISACPPPKQHLSVDTKATSFYRP